MFKRDVVQIKSLILKNLRAQGLETPLLQKRLCDAWPIVAGELISRYTDGVVIRNQTLYVHLTNPALRADLSMQRSEYVRRLNEYVGSQVIAVHLTASKAGKITFTAYMTSPHENVLIGGEGSEATLLGVSSKHEGLKGKVRFQGRMAVQTAGGHVAQNNGTVSVVGADEATLYITVGTNVVNYKDITGDEQAQSRERLHKAMAMGYEALKAQHEAIYKKYGKYQNFKNK